MPNGPIYNPKADQDGTWPAWKQKQKRKHRNNNKPKPRAVEKQKSGTDLLSVFLATLHPPRSPPFIYFLQKHHNTVTTDDSAAG
jgi:hypothetical protein